MNVHVAPEVAPRETPPAAGPTGDRLSAIGWGLFLVWIGVLYMFGLSTAVGLFGVGAITLGVQAARRVVGLALEGFWMAVGGFFVAAAGWEVLDPRLPLISVVLVLAGVALLRSALRRR